MRVLIVVPKADFHLFSTFMPLGALAIGSYARQQGHQVRILDRNVEKTMLQEVLRTFEPQVVGVSLISYLMIADALEVSRQVRNIGLPVVWGGAMATHAAQQAVEERAADYVVSSEGEITFCELLCALENNAPMHNIKGLVFLDEQGSVCQTPQREFAALSDFPSTDWTLIDPNKYVNSLYQYRRAVTWIAAKGCPNKCSFCANEFFNRSQYRKRSMDHVMQEIQYLAQTLDVDMIRFCDEWFYPNKADLREFCSRYRALNISTKWFCFYVPGRLSREELQMMYDSGCRGIVYGIDSGSPAVLKRMNKRIDLDKAQQELVWCNEIGLFAQCAFIIGLPDETKDELRETVNVINKIHVHVIKVIRCFILIPGTAYYQQLSQQGRVTPFARLEDWVSPSANEYFGGIKNYSNIPTKHLIVLQHYFQWQAFWNRKTNQSIAGGVIRSVIANITRDGLVTLFRSAWISAIVFLQHVWYRFAYPNILREYELK